MSTPLPFICTSFTSWINIYCLVYTISHLAIPKICVIIYIQRGDTNVQVNPQKQQTGRIFRSYKFGNKSKWHIGSHTKPARSDSIESEVTIDVRYQKFHEVTLDRESKRWSVKGYFFFIVKWTMENVKLWINGLFSILHFPFSIAPRRCWLSPRHRVE